MSGRDKDDRNLASVARRQSRREIVRGLDEHTSVALLEFQSPTAALIAEPVPISARYTSYILSSLVLVTIILLAVFKVDRAVVTSGQVVSAAPNTVIQPLETSIVRSIRVRAGAIVHKGQLMAELDPTFAGGDDKSTTSQAASLDAEVARLRAELGGSAYASDGTPYSDMQAAMFQQRKQEYEFHVQSLTAKIASLKAKVDQAQADMAFASSRLVGLRDAEQRRVELERLQVGSHLNTLAARDARLQMEGQFADAQKADEGAVRDLQAGVADLNDYKHQWTSDASQTLLQEERLLSDMRSQASKAQLRHQLVEIRAPQDGVVLSVAKVSPGSVMQGGDEFIRLVPIDAQMEVEAVIPGSTAGFVHVGDPVTVKFETFPYIQYGYAVGRVDTVSPDSFPTPPPPTNTTMPQIPNSAPGAPMNMPSSAAVYVARLSITEMRMRNVPADFRLTRACR